MKIIIENEKTIVAVERVNIICYILYLNIFDRFTRPPSPSQGPSTFPNTLYMMKSNSIRYSYATGDPRKTINYLGD